MIQSQAVPFLLLAAAASTILVVAAAAAVLSRLLTHERGPFALFADIRRMIKITLGDGKLAVEIKAVWECPYCMSVWWCMGLHLFLFQGATTWIVRTLVSVCFAWTLISLWRLGDPDDNPPGLIWSLYRAIQGRKAAKS